MTQLLSRHPSVVGFTSGAYDLGSDLSALARVSGNEAPEAVIFYCGRMLEVLAAEAVLRTAREECATAFASLARLEELGRLDSCRRIVFHSLRRLANDARHVQRRLGEADAEVSLAFAQRLLVWFFCVLRPDIAESDLVGELPASSLAAEVGSALRRGECADGELPSDALAEVAERVVRETPVVPAIQAELLLSRSRGLAPAAMPLLRRALERFPEDLRLRQLEAFAARKAGDLDQAIALLEPLYRKHVKDEETAGLLAGSYKAVWADTSRPDRARQRALERAASIYEQSWLGSRQTYTYTGINAATLALLRGDAVRAREIAARLVMLLGPRCPGRPDESAPAPGYWDLATMAEAQLLAGREEEAAVAYHRAFSAFPERREWIATTRGQLQHILQALGRPDVDAFLNIRTNE